MVKGNTSLDEFQKTMLSMGQVGNPGAGNGSYKGQCVSLIQNYLYYCFGIEYSPRGDAKDWATNSNVLNLFDKVSTPQAGDIGTIGAPYGKYTDDNGNVQYAGHIWVYLSPSTILEQNGNTPLRITSRSPYANPTAILRRKGATAPQQEEEVTKATIADVQKIAYWAQGIAPDYPDLQLWVGRDIEYVINDFWNMENSQKYGQRVQSALRGGDQYEQIKGPVFKKKDN